MMPIFKGSDEHVEFVASLEEIFACGTHQCKHKND